MLFLASLDLLQFSQNIENVRQAQKGTNLICLVTTNCSEVRIELLTSFRISPFHITLLTSKLQWLASDTSSDLLRVANSVNHKGVHIPAKQINE